MHTIEKSIEVDVPVRTAYNQWTQFESFPQFMENVEVVEQMDDKRLHWVATVAGQRKEWDAEIVEQVPDQLVSWRSTSGTLNNGTVSFQPVGDNRCKVTVIMTYQPETGMEKLGDMLGLLSAQVGADLKRFKSFIEQRQVETGGWRGTIHGAQVENKGQGSNLGAGGIGGASGGSIGQTSGGGQYGGSSTTNQYGGASGGSGSANKDQHRQGGMGGRY